MLQYLNVLRIMSPDINSKLFECLTLKAKAMPCFEHPGTISQSKLPQKGLRMSETDGEREEKKAKS